jgi:hypothetical protein
MWRLCWWDYLCKSTGKVARIAHRAEDLICSHLWPLMTCFSVSKCEHGGYQRAWWTFRNRTAAVYFYGVGPLDCIGHSISEQTVTGIEYWINHYTLKSKWTTMEWSMLCPQNEEIQGNAGYKQDHAIVWDVKNALNYLLGCGCAIGKGSCHTTILFILPIWPEEVAML